MIDHEQRSHTRAVWTALLVTLLWSSSWVLIRIGLDDESLPPLTFAGLRYTVAVVALFTWVAARPRLRVELAGLDARWLRPLVVSVGAFLAQGGVRRSRSGTQPARNQE